MFLRSVRKDPNTVSASLHLVTPFSLLDTPAHDALPILQFADAPILSASSRPCYISGAFLHSQHDAVLWGIQ